MTNLLWTEQRGKDGGWDSYYSTPYPSVFIHKFVSIDNKTYISAEKIIRENTVLRKVERKVLNILGGIMNSTGISRQTMEEALDDAKYLSNKKKESKMVGQMHYTNQELFKRLKSQVNN